MFYPRAIGSSTIVREKEWNQNNTFGNCPACGSLAIEEINIPGDADITFYCSDPLCRTIMGERSPARTKWFTKKPKWLLEEEEKGMSWNEIKFPGQELPDICPPG